MKNISTFLYQTGTPVLIVSGGLLLLFLILLVYAAMVVSSRADEQMERDLALWFQNIPTAKAKQTGAAYEWH